MKHIITLSIICTVLFNCKNSETKEASEEMHEPKTTISDQSKKIKDYMKTDIVIAHRGSTYWTPEETEPAFLWARNIGADYLEFDVQLTKDNHLIAFHDNDLSRTTNVSELFPDRLKAEINQFTLKELRSLDAGSWFNTAFPDRSRASYKGLKIMTLKDVLMFAEGYRIKKENGESVKEIVEGEWSGNYVYEIDPNDNGNRPGVYIETKSPKPGTEDVLLKQLTKNGWNINENPKTIAVEKGKMNIANTNARVVLQSFSRESIIKIEELLPNIPKCLLLWQPDMVDDLKGNYEDAIAFSIANNIQGVGPSVAGEPNNYEELTAPWMAELIHNAGLVIHPYTFDTTEQLKEYKDRVDGVFTNRADLALEFYGRKNVNTSLELLNHLGY